MRRALSVLVGTLLFEVFAGTATAQLRSAVVAAGFTNPVAMVVDPADPATFYVVEQRGTIRTLQNGVVSPTLFLDIRGQLSTGGERGLLGMAFPPDAAESRRFYINFTNPDGHTVVARYTRDAQGRVDTGSRFDLVWPDGRAFIEQPFSNHNGGHLAFGPDAYLYIGLGDGGSGGDPQNHAQNPNSLLGKMLRIDVSVDNSDRRGYRVPEDNPFVDGSPIAALTEIWAFGLRNPWRYSFDDWTRGGTGALVIADVGQSAREEVNWEPRGAALEAMFNGRYFFADYVAGRVYSIGVVLDERQEATAVDLLVLTDMLGGTAELGLISSFGVDASGEMYIVSYSRGRILKIVP